MGLKRAESVAEALEMAQGTVGPGPSATCMHIPPLFMCKVGCRLAAGSLRGFEVLIPFVSGKTKRMRNMSGQAEQQAASGQ